ncbi:hypothetical protein AHAS_Ahas05G0026500 [Arachis hypogaea]
MLVTYWYIKVTWWDTLSTCRELQDNNLAGPLPDYIANLTIIEYLILADNNFSGSVPATWGRLVDLFIIHYEVPRVSFLGSLSLWRFYLNMSKLPESGESYWCLHKSHSYRERFLFV